LNNQASRLIIHRENFYVGIDVASAWFKQTNDSWRGVVLKN